MSDFKPEQAAYFQGGRPGAMRTLESFSVDFSNFANDRFDSVLVQREMEFLAFAP